MYKTFISRGWHWVEVIDQNPWEEWASIKMSLIILVCHLHFLLNLHRVGYNLRWCLLTNHNWCHYFCHLRLTEMIYHQVLANSRGAVRTRTRLLNWILGAYVKNLHCPFQTWWHSGSKPQGRATPLVPRHHRHPTELQGLQEAGAHLQVNNPRRGELTAFATFYMKLLMLFVEISCQNWWPQPRLRVAGHGVRAPPRLLRPPVPRLLRRQGLQEDPLAWVLQILCGSLCSSAFLPHPDPSSLVSHEKIASSSSQHSGPKMQRPQVAWPRSTLGCDFAQPIWGTLHCTGLVVWYNWSQFVSRWPYIRLWCDVLPCIFDVHISPPSRVYWSYKAVFCICSVSGRERERLSLACSVNTFTALQGWSVSCNNQRW